MRCISLVNLHSTFLLLRDGYVIMLILINRCPYLIPGAPLCQPRRVNDREAQRLCGYRYINGNIQISIIACMNTPKHHKEYRYDCAPSETIVADHEWDDDILAMPSWLEEEQDRADQPVAEPCSSSSGHNEVEGGNGHETEQRKDDPGATPEHSVTISPETHWEPTRPDSHIVEEKPDERDSPS